MDFTKEYFDEVKEACDKLLEFYNRVCLGDDFKKAFGEMKLVMGNGIEVPLSNYVRSPHDALLMDLTACHMDLKGDEIDVRTKSDFPLLYIVLATGGHYDEITWDIFENFELYAYLRNSTKLKVLATKLQKNPENRTYVIARVLDWYDKDLELEYLVWLYRIATIIAKADGVITAKESQALDHIMELKSLSIKNYNEPTSFESVNEKDLIKSEHYKKNWSTSLDELNELVGLKDVKKEVDSLYNFVKVQNTRRNEGFKVPPLSYHCVFTGNPGTGKTTVARILAKIYRELGVIKNGHLVETDRSGLVAEYLGQTAVKTNAVIDSAMNGVLFIDEAYSLANPSPQDYGREAIATLLKRMEDDRDRLVVVLAGYGAEMEQFINANPGLQSRFSRYIQFDDYTADEMTLIYVKLAERYDYRLEDGCKELLTQYLEDVVAHKDDNFGNARYVRNMFEHTLEVQANRLSASNDFSNASLSLITIEDIKNCFERKS